MDFTIKEEPFSWNDNLSEVALEDFSMIQKDLPYGTCQSIGMALAKLELLENQGCEVVEQKHGHWKPTGNIEVLYAKEYACSVCGGIMLGKSEFCPDCGAKMLKGTEE